MLKQNTYYNIEEAEKAEEDNLKALEQKSILEQQNKLLTGQIEL